ncbi:MAG: phosphodiester glycosidase family protein [Armatimonadota bacterium]
MPLWTAFLLGFWGTPTPVVDPTPRTTPVSAPAKVRRVRRIGRTLAPGIELVQELTPADMPGGPLAVTVLRIDPKVPGVRLEAALGQDTVWTNDETKGRELVSKLARRRQAVAAINAGFFPYAGNPIGLHVENGDLVTEPTLRRSSFLIDDQGQARIGAFQFDGAAMVGDQTFVLNGLNRQPGKGKEVLAYTPRFGDSTLAAQGRWEIVLEGIPTPLRPGLVRGTVRAAGSGGATPIPADCMVLSAGGAAAEALRTAAPVGKVVTLRLDVAAAGEPRIDPARIVHAVTGAPRIVTAGKPDVRLEAERVAVDIANGRSPRTAAGIAKDGTILLVVVDGRMPSVSRGATLAELADLLIALGADEAINLDGGGSSTMVVDGVVVNAPSDGTERPVADALLVFGDRETESPDDALIMNAPNRPLKVGEEWRFELPEGVRRDDAVWGFNAGPGFVDQGGLFRALRPGKSTIRLRVGRRTATCTVDVVAAAPSATVKR